MSRTTDHPGAHSPGAQLHRAFLEAFAKLRRPARETAEMAASALRAVAFGGEQLWPEADIEDAAAAFDRRRRAILATVEDSIAEVNHFEDSSGDNSGGERATDEPLSAGGRNGHEL